MSLAGDEVIESINWGTNEESNERCGTDQKGSREGIMGCASMCGQIGRPRDSAQQQGTDFKDAITWLGTSGKTAARELQGAATRHAGTCQGTMRGMLRGIPRNQGQGSVSQNDGKSIAQLGDFRGISIGINIREQ